MVLPFLMIAKALKPMAKIKKGGWKAMGGAFKSLKSSLNPMKSFSKIFEVISIVMLPLTFAMTLLAQVIFEYLMPYIRDVIVLLKELSVNVDTWIKDMGRWAYETEITLDAWLAYVGLTTAQVLDYLAQISGGNLDTTAAMFDNWDLFWDGLISETTKGLEDLLTLDKNYYDDLADFLEDWIKDVLDMFGSLGDISGGGIGGGDGGGGGWDPIGDIIDWFHSGGVVPRTGNYRLQAGETVIDKHSDVGGTSNVININLQDSIIENRDKLIRDITEAVIIRIG